MIALGGAAHRRYIQTQKSAGWEHRLLLSFVSNQHALCTMGNIGSKHFVIACLAVATMSAGASVHAQKAKRVLASTSTSRVAADTNQTGKRPDFAKEKPSRDAYQVAYWVLNSGDNEGSSFVIVDKVQARAYVFGIDGRLRGAAAV